MTKRRRRRRRSERQQRDECSLAAVILGGKGRPAILCSASVAAPQLSLSTPTDNANISVRQATVAKHQCHTQLLQH